MFPLQEPLYFPLELSKNSERWNFPKLELSPRSSLKQQNSGGGSRAGEEVRHKFGENPPKKAPGEEKDCETSFCRFPGWSWNRRLPCQQLQLIRC